MSDSHHHDHVPGEHRAAHGEQEWDERYRSSPEVWSGNPNEVLVAEIASLRPGTALDAGAGEGGDAFWLAERGWRVTAVDVSGVAIERAAKRASERGLTITWLRADLVNNAAPGTYDLVTTHFLHVPKAEQPKLFRHLAAAVAPGGTLLVVGHDFSDMGKLPRPDLAEYGWTAQDVVAVLDDGWAIDVAETRARQTTGQDGERISIGDAVVRARRVIESPVADQADETNETETRTWAMPTRSSRR